MREETRRRTRLESGPRGRSSVGRALASQATPRVPTFDDDRPQAPMNVGVVRYHRLWTPHRYAGEIRREVALMWRRGPPAHTVR
jgi:hypothetical protein